MGGKSSWIFIGLPWAWIRFPDNRQQIEISRSQTPVWDTQNRSFVSKSLPRQNLGTSPVAGGRFSDLPRIENNFYETINREE